METNHIIRNYTGHRWQGKKYNPQMSIKEIVENIRKELKEKFPECKFSVRKEVFSNGCSITVSLMEAPFDPFSDKLDEYDKRYGYHQINHFHMEYLPKEAYSVLKQVVDIVNSYNFDDSESMIDYFDRNFYFDLEIGKWDKPFKQTKNK